MRVDSVTTTASLSVPPTSPKLQAEHELQSSFSAILREVGREGYASADPLPANVAVDDAATESWEDWFNAFGQTRYNPAYYLDGNHVAEAPKPEELKTGFREIVRDAYRTGGYVEPKGYLQSLENEQLECIQHVHGLVDPINVNELSDEASLNLLLPPEAAIDSNGDGLEEVGKARTLRFPSSATPRNVRDAWESATADLPEAEVAIYQLQMAGAFVIAEDAIAIGAPSAAERQTPADKTQPATYLDMADRWLEHLEYFKNQMSPENHQRDTSFWNRFRAGLIG